MKDLPTTEFVLVRMPRTGETMATVVTMVRGDGNFDFSDFSFLRTREGIHGDLEEWVPTAELEQYKQILNVE